MPEIVNEIDNNYQNVLKYYSMRKQDLLNSLSNQSTEGLQNFLDVINTQYIDLLSSKQTSAMTGREVKIKTILDHVYRKADQVVKTAIQDPNNTIYESEIESLRKIQAEIKGDIGEAKQAIDRELTKIVKKFQISTNIHNIVNYMIPQMSSENKKLTADQIQGYVRARIKQNILQQASMVELQKAVKKYPSILYGYYQEDATAEAAIRAIEYLDKKEEFMVFNTGSEKTTIDILISRSKNFNAQGEDEIFKDILKNLDSLQGETIISGNSTFYTDDFFGIQSKPWSLQYLQNPNNKIENSKTSFTIGSRASLKKGFLQSIANESNLAPIDSNIGWHRGVLYLSQHLPTVIGANTILYALQGQVVGTDDLLQTMLDTNRYFAFVMQEKDGRKTLSSKIEIADHYG